MRSFIALRSEIWSTGRQVYFQMLDVNAACTANNELSSITARKSLVLRAFGTIYSLAVK